MKTEADRKNDILDTLTAFVNQRPGMDPRDYGDYRAYRSESASITKDLHDYRELCAQVKWRGITADDLIYAAQGAFSGRLTITEREDGSIAIDYCAGQYFPTEYRKAACAVLAYALRQYCRKNYTQGTLRSQMGRGIASRWFN